MKGSRRKAREISLQVLFQLATGEKDRSPEDAFNLFCGNFYAPKEAREYAWELVSGVVRNRAMLDERLNQASENWRVDRMSHVDRNILRQALYEILFLEDIPLKVSLNEAIDLGKQFGTDDSGAFINGVLDRIASQITQEENSGSADER